MDQTNSRLRIGGIDALRGIAASSVVLQHIYGIHQISVAPWLTWVVGQGLGVPLFFAISAFCLCYAMEEHGREGSPVKAFYLRRFFRIAPLYYTMLLIYMYYFKAAPKHDPLTYALCLFFLYNLLDAAHQPGIVWASWTISIEMIFYAIFPVIHALIRNVWSAAALMLGLMIIAEAVVYALGLPRDYGFYYYLSMLRFLPVFAAGMLAYQLLLRLSPHPRARLIGALFLSASLALIVAYRAGFFGVYYDHAVELACGLAVTGIALCPLRLIVNRVTRFLGQISYSIYLAHPPIIHYSKGLYTKIFALPLPAPACFVVAAAATFAMVLPVAWLLFSVVERTGNRLGRRFAAEVAQRQRPVAEAAPTPA